MKNLTLVQQLKMNISDIDPCLWQVIISYIDPVNKAMFRCTNSQFKTDKPLTVHISIMCARYGYLDFLKLYYNISQKEILIEAVNYGHVHILEWIHTVNPIIDNSLFIECNDVKVVKWLISIGLKPGTKALYLASHEDRFEILKYFVEDYNTKVPAYLLDYAVEKGQIEIVKYLIGRGMEFIAPHIIDCSPHVEMVKFLHTIGHELTENLCFNAAKVGNIEILEYCVENGCRLTESIIFSAAIMDKFDCVIWLLEHNCPPGNIQYGPAYHGRVDILELLISKGHTIDPNISISAAHGDASNVIVWLLEKGYNIDKERTFRKALIWHSINVLDALQSNYRYPATSFNEIASIKVLNWLSDNGYTI